MQNILVVLGGGRPNGNTAQLAQAFVRAAEDAGHRVEVVSLSQTEVKGCTGCNACALPMTSADHLFWTFEQAVSYYQFTLINYIGFHDRGMVLAGGCGDTNGKPQIQETDHLVQAYRFGNSL